MKILIYPLFAFIIFLSGCTTEASLKEDSILVTESKFNKISSVDYDLSLLSTTYAYAQVTSMYKNPEKYLNKTIKIVGDYDFLVVGVNDTQYHFIFIGEGDRCCQTYLEFRVKDVIDEYPSANQRIELQGTFKKAVVFGSKDSYYLLVDEIVII